MNYSRRSFLASGLALVPLASAFAQSSHEDHGSLYERLQQPGRIDKPEVAAAQNVFDSPAPKATNPGRWMAKAPLPLPRSEMAWATECMGRLHLVRRQTGGDSVPHYQPVAITSGRSSSAAAFMSLVDVSTASTPIRTCITPTTRHRTNGSRVILCRRRAPAMEPYITAGRFS